MLGAIIGDIAGSRFESRRNNIKTKDFELFHSRCRFTDDTVMTLAIARAMMNTDDVFKGITAQNKEEYLNKLYYEAVKCMQELCGRYPRAGYGKQFRSWMISSNPQPYNSYGNGAAMRISGIFDPHEKDLEVILDKGKAVTNTTHNHPESIKAIKAVLTAMYYSNNGESKESIKERISSIYDLNFSLADIRETYSFNSSCQGSVPQAIVAFLESTSFEDSIRNAVSIGGDSDTIAAITGSIAEWYYGVPKGLADKAMQYLDEYLIEIVDDCIKRGIHKGGLKAKGA